MNIHEHQAKAVLSEFGVAVPRGFAAFTVEEAVEAATKLGVTGTPSFLINGGKAEIYGVEADVVMRFQVFDGPMRISANGARQKGKVVAALAGIEVFATGGIGGVHRGAATTMDISADLLELARTPVAVVCAGAKSILDLGLTLEVLETHGVPVIGYRTNMLPAFYLRDSGFALDLRLDEAADVAAALSSGGVPGVSDARAASASMRPISASCSGPTCAMELM